MIALLTIWGWLLIGAVIGRVAFVRILADQPRRGLVDRTDQYGRRYTVEDGWTDVFTRAVGTGIACVVGWPLAVPLALMLAHTGVEKLRAKRERLAAEVAALQKQVADGLPMLEDGEVPDAG
jgi:hypothetical protein